VHRFQEEERKRKRLERERERKEYKRGRERVRQEARIQSSSEKAITAAANKIPLVNPLSSPPRPTRQGIPLNPGPMPRVGSLNSTHHDPLVGPRSLLSDAFGVSAVIDLRAIDVSGGLIGPL